MSIKAIVLDMDGTLLTSTKGISERTLKALIKVQEAGVKVILASGRPTSGMLDSARKLEMNKHHGYIISFNGASAVDCEDNQLIYAQAIPKDVGIRLLNHLEKFDVIPMIANDTHMFVNNVYDSVINAQLKENEDRYKNIVESEARGNKFLLSEAEHLADVLSFPLFKVLSAASPAYLKEHYEAMREPFKDILSSSFSAPFYYEFTDKNIDKASTLQKVLERTGLSAEEVMAFGDGHNDISLLKFSGIGIAMGNADPDVKAIADEITLSNEEDGIALKIEAYFPELFK